jgi:adenylate cyclase
MHRRLQRAHEISEVFISYAREDEGDAGRITHELRKQGYVVWRDDELPAHRSYAEVIEERLDAAAAVVVLWSVNAAKSQWVRAEADAARSAGKLVQATLDGGIPPIPFNQIQCADLNRWNGATGSPGWIKLEKSVAALLGPNKPPCTGGERQSQQEVSICVLPFANMSGEAEQEYFSDGISEDITTDLSKVSALEVIARNTAFTFKGQALDVSEVAKKVGVSHVLEGSVRKVGNRVRITAQLIDGSTSGHVWAERYDRELDDIFAIQDEISKAIVEALKLKLLPSEKRAIADRGTSDVEAYNLYLMARQHWQGGTASDPRRPEAIVRMCEQATSIDPNYARAWALMALAQAELKLWYGRDVNALPAAERALSIDADVPEALVVKAQYLEEEGRQEEANQHVERALAADPASWEVNREAARMLFRQGRVSDAIPFFEKAATLMENDYHNAGMLLTCYGAVGDETNRKRIARMTLERVERALAKDPTDTSAVAFGASALGIFGELDRAREWIRRALLLNPESIGLRYNLACALVTELKDPEAALDVLQPYFERVDSPAHIKHLEADPDFGPLREHPRFQEMLAHTKQRLGITKQPT